MDWINLLKYLAIFFGIISLVLNVRENGLVGLKRFDSILVIIMLIIFLIISL
ncbi:uncharacterized protein METZ01_LOCUS232937 [marine metagenome]|uniref:Uncharacterized protein n=1 Tax=marine metagenome TaxID=408172 RepID=A0A382GZW7_9ZZZZ